MTTDVFPKLGESNTIQHQVQIVVRAFNKFLKSNNWNGCLASQITVGASSTSFLLQHGVYYFSCQTSLPESLGSLLLSCDAWMSALFLWAHLLLVELSMVARDLKLLFSLFLWSGKPICLTTYDRTYFMKARRNTSLHLLNVWTGTTTSSQFSHCQAVKDVSELPLNTRLRRRWADPAAAEQENRNFSTHSCNSSSWNCMVVE